MRRWVSVGDDLFPMTPLYTPDFAHPKACKGVAGHPATRLIFREHPLIGRVPAIPISQSNVQHPPIRKRLAWVLLLTFIGGALLLPAIHHVIHPHGLVWTVVDAEDAWVEHVEVTGTDVCVVCLTHASADVPDAREIERDSELISFEMFVDRDTSAPQNLLRRSRAPPLPLA